MNRAKNVAAEFRKIKADYEYNPDIMNEENERSSAVKKILSTMSPEDKTIILLYIYYQSYRELGKRLGVSHMTIRRWVLRIKNNIIEQYEHSH